MLTMRKSLRGSDRAITDVARLVKLITNPAQPETLTRSTLMVMSEIERVNTNLILNLTGLPLSTNCLKLGISFLPSCARRVLRCDHANYVNEFIGRVRRRLAVTEYPRRSTDTLSTNSLVGPRKIVARTLRKFKLHADINRGGLLQQMCAVGRLKQRLMTAMADAGRKKFLKLNFPADQRLELMQLVKLIKNGQIVVRKADKSAQLVLLTRDQYVSGCERLLEDQTNYRKVEVNLFRRTAALTICIVKKYRHLLMFSEEEERLMLLSVRAPRTRRFYALPKTHKPIDKWLNGCPPFRPIVSDINSETAVCGHLISQVLRPYFESIPSYINNSYTLKTALEQLSGITDDYCLFVADIDNLYPSIPIADCFARVKAGLRQSIPLHCFVLELLEVQLKSNYFEFNSETFLQLRGIPMGKAWAPAVASIYLQQWEQNVLSRLPEKPLFYGRYIDDIFCVIRRAHVTQIVELMNGTDTNIRLGAHNSGATVNFLDLTITLRNNGLHFKLYHKESNLLVTLHNRSAHSPHCKRNTIMSQLVRRFRLHSDISEFQESAAVFLVLMRVVRNYSVAYIIRVWKDFVKKMTTKVTTVKPNPNFIVFSVPFAMDTSSLRLITDDFVDELTTASERCMQIVFAHSGQRNIGRLLFRY